MAVMLSALRAGRYQRPSRPQDHSADGRITSIENSNNLMGNRTRYLSACSVVPQPTTLPRAPAVYSINTKKSMVDIVLNGQLQFQVPCLF
jgi:hypothetical protein